MPGDDATLPREKFPQVDIPLDTLFAAMSDIVFVIDRDGRYLWGAPTIAAASEEAQRRGRWLIGKTFHSAVEEHQLADRMLAAVRAALDTGITQSLEYPINLWGVPEWYAASVSRLSEDRVVWVARNVTELVAARQDLEQRVEERTRELTTLLDVSRTLTSARDLRSLVETILVQMKNVIDYTGASVLAIREGEIDVVESLGPAGREDLLSGATIPIDQDSPLWQRIFAGRAVILTDARSDDELSVAFRELIKTLGVPVISYVRSWMALPLLLEDRVVGVLTMSRDTPGYFTEHHVELATAVARQAAVVADNAQLFQETERRTREQASLLQVSHAITSTLDLRELLETILDQLHKFVDYAGASVILREGEMMRQVAVRRPRGPEPTAEDTAHAFPIETWRDLGFPVETEEHVLIDDVHGDSPAAQHYRAMRGGTLEGSGVEYVRSFLGLSLVVRGNVVGVLALAHDEPGFLTEHHLEVLRPFAVQAAIAIENAQLFQQTRRAASEQEALLEVSRAVASTLDISRVLAIVLAEIERLIGVTGASVLTVEGDQLVFRDVMNVPGRRDQVGLGIPLASAGLMWKTLANSHAPVVIADVRADTQMAADYRRIIDDLGATDLPPFQHVRSWMGVPLFVHDRIIGMLTMSRTVPDYFTPDHARLASIFADQVAVAIENARLFEQTQTRSRELAAVLQVSRAIATTLDLNQVIDAVLDNLQVLVEHTGSALITLEGDGLVIRGSRATEGGEREVGLRIALDRGGFIWQQMLLQKPVLIPDIRADEPAANGYRETIDSIGLLNVPPFSLLRAWMGVPLIVSDRVTGILSLSHTEPGRFTEEHARLAASFAAQAAIAIENARLYERAQGVAALEERQRLARELHDSVSQALYGIALGARTAMTQLERDPTKAAEPVEYILSLAEAGLAEMRALIFELRPESMEMEGLVAAIEKQVAAGRARYGIAIDAQLGDEPDAPLETKEAVYRIAQEALHNIVKHARATKVTICLESQDSALVLRVADNGAGFDPTADYAGHLGLRSMRERASLIGGSLEITSQSGAGTTIVATVPVRR